ncbi:DUF6270 domain-containing protein [Devriesea agamarum]|uniref:DUF6270 domain-containing protein n=1 Tax=Devriesea agamarum TaxID=472569 RepID=UPI00071C9230|nr:DUF6270 domain-containing protein [Devriesea agamarum]
MSRSAKVVIYGSCVSRDALEFVTTDDVSVDHYIARQSLLSAFGGPVEIDVDTSGLTSPFQRRMVEGDIAGSAAVVLRERTPECDVLLWDLMDERDGVYETPGGGRITNSVELRSTDFVARWKETCRLTRFGSRRYMRLFDDALRSFADLLDDIGCRERSLLIAAPLATSPLAGVHADADALSKIKGQQEAFGSPMQELAERVQEEGLPVLFVPDEVCSFDPQHKWGLASYHYSADFYRFVVGELERRLGVGLRSVSKDAGCRLSLAQPHALASDGVARHHIGRPCQGVSAQLTVTGTARDPLRGALMVLTFREEEKFKVHGANYTEFKGHGHYVYIPLRSQQDIATFNVSWDEPRYLKSVDIVPWEGAKDLLVHRFDVEVKR